MITAHVRVRDEPFIFLTLASVAPYIEKVIVFDTGSTDHTVDDIKLAQKEFGNIDLYERKIPNAQGWTIAKLGRPEQKPSQALGDIRREIHAMTPTTFSLVLDGDEVYPEKLIKAVVDVAEQNMFGDNILCAHVSVMDFFQDFRHIHHHHSFGRLFRKEGVEIRGGVPGEMHLSTKTGKVLDQSPTERMNITCEAYMHHHELFIKPWRRKPYTPRTYDGPWPEVYAKYKDIFVERLGKWGAADIV